MNQRIRLYLMVFCITFASVSYLQSADELRSFPSSKLVENQEHDGDSFLVDTGETKVLVRLYFVDCLESSTSAKSDAALVREQARYFGLPDATRVVHFGKEAGRFVEEVLQKPFTLHTAFATAPGRSTDRRVYGFITTTDGNDLGTLLVERGLARAHGIGRESPNKISREEMVGRLNDLEVAAMLKRTGIWAESDPDRIAELRASQRSEDKELKDLQDRTTAAQHLAGPIDLNTATRDELQSVDGIGPVLADSIIAARPFKSVDDLKKVRGIGEKNFERFSPHFVVKEEQ